MNQEAPKQLGIVVSGSLTKGVEVKLDNAISVEDMAVGRYVTIEGERQRFLGMVTDVSLGAIDPRVSVAPPDLSDPFIAEVIKGSSTYGSLHVMPQLALGEMLGLPGEGPQPVKTVPAHFSVVREASQRDIELVFGSEDERLFYIGNPLDMETKVCLDLAQFVMRSNGIFGKSGTGKTFLTRLLLVGLLQKDVASSLVFDMHNEYGWEGRSEHGYKVKALKQLFPSKVAVFTLDEESSRRRGVSTDFVVNIGYDEIEPEDVELLSETLGLTEAAKQACYRLARRFGQRWLESFLALESREDLNSLANSLGEHEATLASLHRRLDTLRRLAFLVPQAADNSVRRILEYLERGINVVLEFGRYTDITAYILVANLLTRRIHAQYRARTEEAMGADRPLPRPLVITIEEAHKFLNPQVADQTIFGTIAREMRKYNVTLLVIDQRPSGIDDEVMSQLGTKITCLLDNERDIEAVLTGTPGRGELRSVLSRLETKQQALIFGHALPVPVVVKVREYGSAESYKSFGFKDTAELKRQAEADIDRLWGDG